MGDIADMHLDSMFIYDEDYESFVGSDWERGKREADASALDDFRRRPLPRYGLGDILHNLGAPSLTEDETDALLEEVYRIELAFDKVKRKRLSVLKRDAP